MKRKCCRTGISRHGRKSDKRESKWLPIEKSPADVEETGLVRSFTSYPQPSQCTGFSHCSGTSPEFLIEVWARSRPTGRWTRASKVAGTMVTCRAASFLLEARNWFENYSASSRLRAALIIEDLARILRGVSLPPGRRSPRSPSRLSMGNRRSLSMNRVLVSLILNNSDTHK